MKIALIGYGKMGKAIEQIALKKGHEIVLAIHRENIAEFTKEKLANADVAIEFTNPHSAFENIKKLLEFGVPVVCGSTGWTDQFSEAKKSVKKITAVLSMPAILVWGSIFFLN